MYMYIFSIYLYKYIYISISIHWHSLEASPAWPRSLAQNSSTSREGSMSLRRTCLSTAHGAEAMEKHMAIGKPMELGWENP